MTKLKKILISVQLVACSLWLFPPPVRAAWGGDCVAVDNEGVGDVATIKGIECLFESVISIALRLVGLATFIMILVGGFKLLTAGSDPKAAASGQQTITMGVIGLILTIVAWFILYGIEKFTGVPVTQFALPTL